MQGLDIEEVRLAGKPKVEHVVRTDKTIRCVSSGAGLRAERSLDLCYASGSVSLRASSFASSAFACSHAKL